MILSLRFRVPESWMLPRSLIDVKPALRASFSSDSEETLPEIHFAVSVMLSVTDSVKSYMVSPLYQPANMEPSFVGSSGCSTVSVLTLTNHWVGTEPLPPFSSKLTV